MTPKAADSRWSWAGLAVSRGGFGPAVNTESSNPLAVRASNPCLGVYCGCNVRLLQGVALKPVMTSKPPIPRCALVRGEGFLLMTVVTG